MARDYYEVLGVPRSASEKDIRNAYRRLARRHHPDVNPGDNSAEARFKEINEAYQVLSDPGNRQRYDTFGHQWQHAAQEATTKEPPTSWFFRAGRPGARPSQGRAASSSRDPFGDLFDDLIGARQGGRLITEDIFEGGAVEVPVTASLEEAYSGTTRVVQVPGIPAQGTAGHRLEVKLPPGIDTGSRIHISTPGRGRAPGTDIYLSVTVSPHPRFERKGDDLYSTVLAPLTDAVLGGEVQVPTIKGSPVVLKLPAETQNGRTFRLRGQGMPRLSTERAGGGNQYGDLFVTVQVQLPNNLSSEERQLYVRLRSLRPPAGEEGPG
jgi:DnaJ-class molecular chaperone